MNILLLGILSVLPDVLSMLYAFQWSIYKFFRTPFQVLSNSKITENTTITKPMKIRLGTLIFFLVILPFVIILLFSLLYSYANPKFASIVERLFFHLGNLLEWFINHININIVAIHIGGYSVYIYF